MSEVRGAAVGRIPVRGAGGREVEFGPRRGGAGSGIQSDVRGAGSGFRFGALWARRGGGERARGEVQCLCQCRGLARDRTGTGTEYEPVSGSNL